MILGLQIIALTFSLIMIYLAYTHKKRGEINNLELISWVVCWVGAILIITFPELFSIFAKNIAISRAFDLAVLGGFILIIPIVYQSYIKTKKLEKKFEEYIRLQSLSKFKKNK